jgi:hypothetical protein
MKCPHCDYESDNVMSLSLHFRRKHKETAKQLAILLFHDGQEPTCECGCGEPVRFYSINAGFARFRTGHNNSVHNNWGHNEKALKRSQDVRREMWKRGEIKAWCTGKTKETDERIARMCKKASKTIRSNPEELRRRSERMRKGRLDGTIPTKYGEESSQWKGGTSKLQQVVRSRLHNAWARPILERDRFVCQGCGQKSGKLVVHHSGERFAQILQKALEVYGYIEDDVARKNAIALWVIGYHVDNQVPGTTLCESCHDSLHAGA